MPHYKPPVVVRLLTWTILLSSLFLSQACDDTVTTSNRANGQDAGILVDGNTSSGFSNDITRSGPADLFGVGDLTAGAGGEIVGFTNLRPVAIKENVAWTNGDDDETLAFSNKILIPVTVWIVKGPFNTSRTNAINMCITTSNIWDSERMGIAFAPFQIVDATGNPDASRYFDFDCSMKNGIEADIGKTNGRINVYVVETVDGGAARGQACQIGSDFVAIATGAGTELLAHEFGHDFALQHIDGQASFDQTNVMHSASNTRQFLTEGQLFRAHLRTNSALNFVYGARPGQPTRNCSHNQVDNGCPALNKRIWADGAFPAN